MLNLGKNESFSNFTIICTLTAEKVAERKGGKKMKIEFKNAMLVTNLFRFDGVTTMIKKIVSNCAVVKWKEYGGMSKKKKQKKKREKRVL